MFKRTHSRQEVGYDVYTVYDVIQDSVISKTKVPGGVQYMCSSRAYQRTVYDFQNRPATESWSGTGEIVRFYPDKAIFLIDTANMPEEGTLQNVYYYYPNDSSRCYKSPSYKRKSYSFPQALDTQPDEYAIYKVGFGLTDSAGGFRYGVNDYQRYYSQSVSAKKSGLVCGYFVPLSAGISVPGSICSVFPNPATDQLSVELPLSARYAVINISDISGRHVLNQSLHYGSNQISIRDFSNGTYLLQIISGNATRTERLVIAH